MARLGTSTVLAVALLFAGSAGVVRAQPRSPVMGANDGSRPVQAVPGLEEKVDVDEQLDKPLPTDLTFTDHTGKKVKLASYFDGERPVLLTFAYFTCPVLCSLVLDATEKGVEDIDWTLGDEYDIVTISIDPRDTPERAAKKRAELLEKYGRADAGWHFLVGDQENIDAATEAAGFNYFYDERQEQYGHPAVAMFLTPDAKFARYLYGLVFKPADVSLALLEASKGNSISTVEKVILYCYSYDPEGQGYTLMAFRVMQIGAGLTVAVLGFFLFFMWRREVRKRRREDSAGAPPPGAHRQVETS